MAGNQQSGVQACLLWELYDAVTERMQLCRPQEAQALGVIKAGCRLCVTQTSKLRAKYPAMMLQGGLRSLCTCWTQTGSAEKVDQHCTPKPWHTPAG